MALPLTIPDGSTFRLFYAGPIGVVGALVQQSWDLSALPRGVREDPTFRDNFRVFVRQVDPGISFVSPIIDFSPASGAPNAIILTLTTAAIADLINIEFWYVHSIVR